MQECFEHAIQTLDQCEGWKGPPHAMSQFWGAHQRFFKQLLMAMKVPSVVALAQEARRAGKCVVIGLQTTGEARMAEALKEAGEEGLEDFRGLFAIIENLLETQFPTRGHREEDTDADGLAGDDDDGAEARGSSGGGASGSRAGLASASASSKNSKAASASASAAAASSSSAGSSSSAAARKRPLPSSDEDDSDDELSLEGAVAKQQAIEAAPRTFSRFSAAMLQLSCAAFVQEYKIPKQRDDKLKRLVELYKGLWEFGPSHLRRRLTDLGVKPEAKAALGLTTAAKAALVQALWNRTIINHYRLLATSGEAPATISVADLAKSLGLDASSPLLEGSRTPTHSHR